MTEGNAEILIVDNDERIVELVAWFLKKRGFGVRTATSFTEARERIAESRPDLMLSDLDLGAESAMDELPRLAEDGLLPPTLVVSGYLDADVQADLDRLTPVLGTLAKPFDFAVLEERIHACLERAGAGTRGAASGVPGGAAGEVGEVGEGWIEITPARPPAAEGSRVAR